MLHFGAAQIIMIVLYAMGLGISAAKHGESKEETKYNFWVTLICTILVVALLAWGGFWTVQVNEMLVSDKCKDCKYKGEVLFGELCCDYILITGKKRGCPAGDECDRYKKEENTA